jgi:hypothetical protein
VVFDRVNAFTSTQVLSYASIVRYLVYQQGKEIDLLVGTLRDHCIGTFNRSPNHLLHATLKPY